jgi:hypothetical protein
MAMTRDRQPNMRDPVRSSCGFVRRRLGRLPCLQWPFVILPPTRVRGAGVVVQSNDFQIPILYFLTPKSCREPLQFRGTGIVGETKRRHPLRFAVDVITLLRVPYPN